MSIRLYQICDKAPCEADEHWPREAWVKIVEAEHAEDLPPWAQEAISHALWDAPPGTRLLLLTFFRTKGEPVATYRIEAYDRDAGVP